jgi:hypothetical protein
MNIGDIRDFGVVTSTEKLQFRPIKSLGGSRAAAGAHSCAFETADWPITGQVLGAGHPLQPGDPLVHRRVR